MKLKVVILKRDIIIVFKTIYNNPKKPIKILI